MSSNPVLFLRTKRHKVTHAASWLVVASALTGPLAAKNEAAVTQSALDRIVAAQQVAEEAEEQGTQEADQNPETPASEQPVQ
ncbi:MAG: hypothetical protein AAFR32_03545, partial [Pseudomonadota bacterium]